MLVLARAEKPPHFSRIQSQLRSLDHEPQLGAINEDGHDILCPACGSQQRSLNGLHLHLSKCPTLDLDLTGLGSAEACIQLAIFLSLQENGHPDDVERVDLNQRVAEYGLKFPPPGAITTKGNCFFDSVALQQFLLEEHFNHETMILT